MSLPVVIAALSLLAGVCVADFFLYDADWLATANEQASWVLIVPWGFCVLLALLGFWWHRRLQRMSLFTHYALFPWLTALFFFSLGFGRYALTAERQHHEWAVRGKPVPHGNPDEFDFVRWDWVQGVPLKPWEIKKDSIGAASRKPSLRERGLAWREKLTSRLKQLKMEPEQLAVVMAMTLGDRSQLSHDTRDLYADAGASHLLALSGLHLGIIVGLFLTWMNGRLLMSRWRRPVGVMVLVFIWAYCLVAGMPTSLVRASLMSSFFVVASLLQRYGLGIQHLLLAIIVMLLWRPLYLFDVGAQLSFASVAGILIFYPPLHDWCFERWRFQMFALERYHMLWPFTGIAVALCAQILTLPLVAYYFHQIPLYGAFLGVVLIPLTTVIIYGSLLMLALTFVWPLLATWLSVGVGWLVGVQCWVMATVSTWPGAVIHDFWSEKAQPQVVVYHNRRCPALHLIASPQQSYLLLPTPERADSGLYYIRRDFWKRRLTTEPQVLAGRHEAAVAGFHAVMMDASAQAAANHLVRTGASCIKQPVSVDILWITTGFRGGKLGNVASLYTPRLVVLDACLPLWQRASLARDACRRRWSVYDVAEQGALHASLVLEQ